MTTGRIPRWFQTAVLRRRWLTFVVLVLSFIGFGVGSVNLFVVLQANLGFIAEHGWTAVMDGALSQLLGLLVMTAATMAAYVVFKTCEHTLVHWLGSPAD